MGTAKNGFLAKREGHVAMFSRAELDQVARRYVFSPEMIRRSVFNQTAQMNGWLRSVVVLPAATLRDAMCKV